MEKEIEIALMLGAIIENWYPPNKDTKTSGIHLSFPTTLINSNIKWYPDNKRYHADSLLKFSTDANWQFAVINWIEQQGYIVTSYQNTCEIESSDGEYSETNNQMLHQSYYEISGGKTRQKAMFEAIYQFSQYLKQK